MLGPDPFFDELFLGAAARRFVTAERVVEPGRLIDEGPIQTMTVTRLITDAVAEVPGGAHFTSCDPDYHRDESFQKAYARPRPTSTAGWSSFDARFLRVDEAGISGGARGGSITAAGTGGGESG